MTRNNKPKTETESESGTPKPGKSESGANEVVGIDTTDTGRRGQDRHVTAESVTGDVIGIRN